jgi:PAS domain S-box-containing protein
MNKMRVRLWAAVILVGCLEAVVSLVLGTWYGGSTGPAAGLGILVAAAAGVAGGPVAGGVVAAVGWGLFFWLVADGAVREVLALPAWIALGVLTGLLGARLWGATRDGERLAAEVAALRECFRDAIFSVDAKGIIREWNRGAEELYGYTRDEVVGRAMTTLAPEDRHDELLELVAGVGEGGSEAREVVHRRSDGDQFGVFLTAASVPAGKGEAAQVLVVAHDLRQLHGAEERVREAASKYDALAALLPLAVYAHAVGRRDRLVEISAPVEAMLGYSVDEWLAEPGLFGRLLHPDDRERVIGELAAAGEKGAPCRVEYRLLARDGRLVWVRDASVVLRGAGGEPAYTLGYFVEVTAEKRSEDERQRLVAAEDRALAQASEKQRRLDLLARANAVLASSLDYQMTLRRTAELVAQELADCCVIDIVEDDGSVRRVAVAYGEPRRVGAAHKLPNEPEEAILRVIKSEEPALVGARKDGDSSFGAFESYVSVPLQARGRALGALTLLAVTPGRTYGRDELSLARDLACRAGLAIDNARLYAEAEERAEAARVLANVGDGVFLVDRVGVVRLWNAAAEAITGLPAGAVLGRPAIEAIPGWRAVVEHIPVAASPELHDTESVPIETSEGERWISISGVEFFGGIVYAFRDFTEEHRVDALKAEFVATASHELRTPLAAVYGAAQTLRRHDFALDEAGRDRFLSLIVEESERLGRIVNEILLASQLEGGRVEVASEPFDPVELVERAIEATRTYLPPHISLEIAAPSSVPAVAADRDKLRQVLVNLVENAIKYSPEGGTIEIGLEAEEDIVRFWVKDQGLGIPYEERGRIFEKFYRIDPHMTRGVGGTGLGLYICSELVSRMGGRIWVESSDNEGSTFLLELPVAATSALHPVNHQVQAT